MTTSAQSARQIWDATLGALQVQITKPSYDTWLKDTIGISFNNQEFVIGTPNAFIAEMLEKRMYSMISNALEQTTNEQADIKFQVFINEPSQSNQSEPIRNSSTDDDNSDHIYESPTVQIYPRQGTPLNNRYSFNNFVVGKANELAYAAATAISSNLGSIYNPLVIYSGVGLGKTHLLHAVGHSFVNQGRSLIYVTSEEFTNEYIKAIRTGQTDDFRDRYRNVDALLIDDIQFLIGKEQTQEGFFHTFNALHVLNKQIVITSDRPPEALTVLESRISSRLSGGLVVDIQAPDIETRLAILKSKAEHLMLTFPEDVLELIARCAYKNVRELEGALNKLAAFSNLTREPIDLALAERVACSHAESLRRNDLTEKEILNGVSSFFDTNIETLRGRARDKRTSLARHVAMYLLREEAHLGASAIGRVLGGKDHSTVLHGWKVIERRKDQDDEIKRAILKIRESFDSQNPD